MAAAAATTTGADFLLAGLFDGNLRRINSSEETAVESDDDGAGHESILTDPQVNVLSSGPRYSVVTLDHDSAEPVHKSPPSITLPPIVAQIIDTGTCVAMITYLSTAGYLTATAFFAGKPWVGSALFITGKVLNYTGQFVDHVWRLRSSYAPKRDVTPHRRILGDEVPKVHIIITAYNEHVENVIDTVAAAAAVDYPTDKFQVFVSDDGKDAKLEEAVSELKLTYTNITYFARDKSNRPNGPAPHGSKAGNVNDCIHYAKQQDKDQAEYFLCLDADMIPGRDIVRALVAHAVEDKKVAMVTLPQHFYNLPADDPIGQNMLIHAECEEVMRDRLESAWCPGSGFLMSSKVLAAVGGFPETSIAEDVLFSWILQGRGWKIVYVNEKLQWGLQPNSLASHIGQRTKWCVGHVNNSWELGFCLKHPRTKDMSPIQRWIATSYCIKPWLTVPKFLSWVITAMCLYSGQAFVAATTQKEMRVLLIVHFVFWAFTRLSEVSQSRVYGYWSLIRRTQFNIWMSPYLTWAIIREKVLPYWMGGHKLGFTSTGSMRAAVDERNSETRGGLFTRLLKMNRDTLILGHLAFFFFMVGLVFRNALSADDRLKLVSTALFPGLGFEQMPAFLSLVAYAINPPTDVPRRSLMKQDEYGVWRPAVEAQGAKWSAWIYLQELPNAVVTMWAFAVIFLFI